MRVNKDGDTWEMEFHSYYDKNEKKYESGIPVAPLHKTGKCGKAHGTLVHFMPDDAVFGDNEIQLSSVSHRLRELAFLNKGLKITLTDERVTQNEMASGEEAQQLDLLGATQPYRVTYHYEGGISDFVAYLNEEKTSSILRLYIIKGRRMAFSLSLQCSIRGSFTENLFSFVNNIPTPEGGYHETDSAAGSRAF